MGVTGRASPRRLRGGGLASPAARARYRPSVSSALDVVGGIGLGDLTALVAIAISMVALARPWWNERKASLEVRSEEYRRIRGNRADIGARFVVRNHGPARARGVEVRFFHDGQPVNLALIGWANQAQTPLLHPGEEYHMNYALTYGENMPELVVVTWRDARQRRHRQEFYPSVREL